MRETEPTRFMDELCELDGGGMMGHGSGDHRGKKKRRVHPLNMDGFLDTKATEGKYDFSEWVRAHCKFIDESLDTYYQCGWYTDLEKSGKESRLRAMPTEELLETLPRVQRIQRRLVECRPTGGACQNDNTLLALSLVVRESFTLFKAVSEGIINLADKFFQMNYYDGIKAMEIYNEALQGGEELQKYHASLQQMDAVKRVIQFPKMENPPSDFLDTMKEHLKELRKSSADGTLSSTNQPLRKGKEAKNPENTMEMFQKKDSSILIAPMSREVSEDMKQSKPEESTIEPEIQVEEVENNLLDLDDEAGIPSEVPPMPTTDIADPDPEKSDLDLLSDLDFSALHLDTSKEPSPSTVTQHSSTNPISDAFVVNATTQMYGKSFGVNRKESTASVTMSSPPPSTSNNPFA